MPVTIPNPRSQKRARIEIIPLIDIIFFLLATFVMVSFSMVQNQSIPVHLPVARTSEAMDRDRQMTITVSESGDYYINKERLSFEMMVDRLKQLKKNDSNLKLFLNGDAKTDFERVVLVLDEARKLGISKIAIQTTKK